MKLRLGVLVASVALVAVSGRAGTAAGPADGDRSARPSVESLGRASPPKASVALNTDDRGRPIPGAYSAVAVDRAKGEGAIPVFGDMHPVISERAARLSAPTANDAPRPGAWAVLLASLLGAGAIARRRILS